MFAGSRENVWMQLRNKIVAVGILVSIIIFFGLIYVLFRSSPSDRSLIGTHQFTHEITGRVFERETWEIDRPLLGPGIHRWYYEVESNSRNRVSDFRYRHLTDDVLGGIDLVHGFIIPLYEPFPVFLSHDKEDITFTRISPNIRTTFIINRYSLSYYFSDIRRLNRNSDSVDVVRTKPVEVDITYEQFQEILRSLEQAEQQARGVLDSYNWRMRIASDDYTTFFYINGDEAYQLLRSLIHAPTYLADYNEVGRLLDIYSRYNEYIQAESREQNRRWHEKNNSWDRNAGEEARETAQAELRSIIDYHNVRMQIFFDKALYELAEMYAASDSDVTFEYESIIMMLTAIFDKSFHGNR